MKRRRQAEKVIYFFLAALVVLCAACVSTPPVDAAPESGTEQYLITFLAYGAGTAIKRGHSIAGHASLSINRTGVWGFYPDKTGQIISKRGKLIYSEEYPRAQEYVDFYVDAVTMRKIMALIEKWQHNPPFFAIPFNDCVSFIYRVCDIAAIRRNPFALIPTNAICEIRKLNSEKAVLTNKN